MEQGLFYSLEIRGACLSEMGDRVRAPQMDAQVRLLGTSLSELEPTERWGTPSAASVRMTVHRHNRVDNCDTKSLALLRKQF